MTPPLTSATLEASPNIGAVAPKQPEIPTHYILGIRFHSLQLNQALDIIDHFIAERTPHQISFSNAQTIALCQKDPELQRIINQSHLNLADGMSIVWGAQMLGLKLPERVAGPDLMNALCQCATEKNYRIFLLGSTPSNLLNLKDVLMKRWPSLPLAGMYSPPIRDRFNGNENEQIIHCVQAARPDILFAGISCPKQEYWIAENLQQLNVPVCLGVGAAFDFLSGRIPRAPEWLRRRGLEWLFRLSREPRRLWKRYLLGNLIFLSLLAREKIKFKVHKTFKKPR
ncbi:MAG: WecB/TagA/CpsF family glycosyltransferase [Elusimicrobia bacterium]|nr:WecB/TagA/CpsF family glycosyltransferase [Candidatus Obscuribacterium magneticum]